MYWPQTDAENVADSIFRSISMKEYFAIWFNQTGTNADQVY